MVAMKISIITVCLNSEKTIEKTIQSVVGQKDADYEYIVIDGNSTDRTLEIVRNYEKYIAVVVSEPDQGVYDAMNKGIGLATGDVIGIINGDDWYEPGIFKTIGCYFEHSDAEVIYGNLNLISETGEIEELIPGDIEKIRYEMATPHPTVFVKREIYKKYGSFQLKYRLAADYELMLRLYTEGVRFGYMDRVIANFRQGGMSEKQGEKCSEETLKIAQSYLFRAPLAKRKYFRDIVAHGWKRLYFERLLEDSPYVLGDILQRILGAGPQDPIAVFGAGKWGMKVYKILQSLKIQSLFIVDNSREKQGKRDDGTEVLPPEKLKSFRGVLLAVVKEHSTAILKQTAELGNSMIYCISWEEIASVFMAGFGAKEGCQAAER